MRRCLRKTARCGSGGGPRTSAYSRSTWLVRRRRDMLTRRRALQLIGTAGAVAASTGPAIVGARAQGRPFTFCSFGGALSTTEKAAFMDPVGKKFGVEIANVSP